MDHPRRHRASPLPASANGKKKLSRPLWPSPPSAAAKFTTVSSYPINRLYTDADLADWNR